MSCTVSPISNLQALHTLRYIFAGNAAIIANQSSLMTCPFTTNICSFSPLNVKSKLLLFHLQTVSLQSGTVHFRHSMDSPPWPWLTFLCWLGFQVFYCFVDFLLSFYTNPFNGHASWFLTARPHNRYHVHDSHDHGNNISQKDFLMYVVCNQISRPVNMFITKT